MNNDFIKTIMQALNAQTDVMCANAGQITLGELVARLEAANENAPVQFADGTYPGELSSYRGYYRYVAIEKGDKCTVGDFLEQAKAAIGHTFTGYKGGDFKMTRMTPVWVSEWGMASGKGVIDVDVAYEGVILNVAQIEE